MVDVLVMTIQHIDDGSEIMKNIMFLIFTVSFVSLFAEAKVEYSEKAESYLDMLKKEVSTSVNSGVSTNSDFSESMRSSWIVTPEYIYIKSSSNESMKQIETSLNKAFGKDYEIMLNEKKGVLKVKKERFSKKVKLAFPKADREKEIKKIFSVKAISFLDSIPEIAGKVMVDGFAIEKHDSNDGKAETEITEIRVYFRRVFDGAVFSDNSIPVKLVYDTASEELKSMKVRWPDYMVDKDSGGFERSEVSESVSFVQNALETGKTMDSVFGNEDFDSIYVYTVEKVWKKKKCNGVEYLVPALRFFMKVKSENGLKSVMGADYSEIKETVISPSYELQSSLYCQ